MQRMRLWAISDLHVGYEENRRAVERLAAAAEDWLILAGDTGESPAHLDFVLKTLTPRFAQIIWAPGNHDLWTPRSLASDKRGVAHYERLVRLCQRYGVLTPEDPFAVWPGDGPRTAIVPTFLLYDYSFRPDDIALEHALDWAAATGLRCADEDLLAPSPFASRIEWCQARVAETEHRLDAIPRDVKIVLANHYPLRREHAVLPRIPRFSIWCGTRLTEHWHSRYNLRTVVYGHLHIRKSHTIGETGFEEVSLGYPKQWDTSRAPSSYLRRIL